MKIRNRTKRAGFTLAELMVVIVIIGLLATLVSGQLIYRDGEATGALPGRLVRGRQQAAAA